MGYCKIRIMLCQLRQAEYTHSIFELPQLPHTIFIKLCSVWLIFSWIVRQLLTTFCASSAFFASLRLEFARPIFTEENGEEAPRVANSQIHLPCQLFAYKIRREKSLPFGISC